MTTAIGPTLPYAELHCLSNFSFLRGASHPEELVEQAAALGYSALALTDECTLAGVVRAHMAAKSCGLKLIIGSEFTLDDGLKLVLLAQNRNGYGNLSELITRARRATEKGDYLLRREDLHQGLENNLALWIPGQQPDAGDAHWLAAHFPGRAWIAAQWFANQDQHQTFQSLYKVSKESGLPLVACGDIHMHKRQRKRLQDTLTAIRLGRPVHKCGFALFGNAERHLRQRQVLTGIYPAPWLQETQHLSRLCTFSLDELRYEYPDELVPAGKTATVYLRELTQQGIQQRWPHGVTKKVHQQIEHELVLIAELQYEPYFLTVYDIVSFARSRNILCQGRGSAANSAVCYCLGITEVDPARMSTLFERFISKERNEPPDIDVDFEHQRREEVIQYIYNKYGRDRAALAATIITYRPRSAIRDVGKALGLTLEQVDRLAKSLAWWDGRKVLAERLQECGFDPSNPIVVHLMQLVQEIQGFPRHLSQHVGGFVISRGPLCRMVPIENAAMEKRTVIQWDKDDLDNLGLLKVDCLALGMLSAIHKALDLISTQRGQPFTMSDIPAEDPATYAMIQQADTLGVFQIESRAQMSMLPRLRPESFYDLVIEVAIIRPGPIQGGMIHPYLRRRRGEEPVTYPSEQVKDVLQRTLGVPIFQEQVMQLAITAAGFTPGEADQLRRSMAAWKRKGGLAHFEQRLIQGMKQRGYPEEFAQQVFQQILGFGEYGFPESHAASFALLAYVSAWLKCHHPAAFTCSLLNSQPMGFYAPAQLIQDAQRHGVEILPVDARYSEWDCTLETPNQMQPRISKVPVAGRLSKTFRRRDAAAEPTGMYSRRVLESLPATGTLAPSISLRLGLRLIKGLSQPGAQRLVETRLENPFTSIQDLTRRSQLNQHDMQCLSKADALAGISGDRHQSQWQVLATDINAAELPHWQINETAANLRKPTVAEDLVADYQQLGLSLRPHPLSFLRQRFQQQNIITATQLKQRTHKSYNRVAGLVINRQRPGSADGVIFMTLEDESGHINVVIWSSLLEQYRREVLNARLLGVDGILEREGEVLNLVAKRLFDHTSLLGGLVTHSRDFH